MLTTDYDTEVRECAGCEDADNAPHAPYCTAPSVTIENTYNGAYYLGIDPAVAQAMSDEWNEGLGRNEWRVVWH